MGPYTASLHLLSIALSSSSSPHSATHISEWALPLLSIGERVRIWSETIREQAAYTASRLASGKGQHLREPRGRQCGQRRRAWCPCPVVLDGREESLRFMCEAVFGQSVEHLDGIVSEPSGAHPMEDFLKVGGVGRVCHGGLLAEGVVGRRQGGVLCRGCGWRCGGALVVVGPVEGDGAVRVGAAVGRWRSGGGEEAAGTGQGGGGGGTEEAADCGGGHGEGVAEHAVVESLPGFYSRSTRQDYRSLDL